MSKILSLKEAAYKDIPPIQVERFNVGCNVGLNLIGIEIYSNGQKGILCFNPETIPNLISNLKMHLEELQKKQKELKEKVQEETH